jgi:hypothetical protein
MELLHKPKGKGKKSLRIADFGLKDRAPLSHTATRLSVRASCRCRPIRNPQSAIIAFRQI